MPVKLLGPWIRDSRAYDPSVHIRNFEYAGRVFTARNTMGPGWYMSIVLDGRHIGMANWENWDQAADVAAAA